MRRLACQIRNGLSKRLDIRNLNLPPLPIILIKRFIALNNEMMVAAVQGARDRIVASRIQIGE